MSKTLEQRYQELDTLNDERTQGVWISVGSWVENAYDNLPDICSTDAAREDNNYKQQMKDAEYIASAPDMMDLLSEYRQLLMQIYALSSQLAGDSKKGEMWLALAEINEAIESYALGAETAKNVKTNFSPVINWAAFL